MTAVTSVAPPSVASIDLNADLGEGFGRYRRDGDLEVMSLITSVNIACGFMRHDRSACTPRWDRHA